MNRDERNRLFVALRMEGYVGYAPSKGSDEIDRGVCAKATCPECGHDGMSYRPFCKIGSYVAFACCPECGYAEEF